MRDRVETERQRACEIMQKRKYEHMLGKIYTETEVDNTERNTLHTFSKPGCAETAPQNQNNTKTHLTKQKN